LRPDVDSVLVTRGLFMAFSFPFVSNGSTRPLQVYWFC
jgi:hypothetical protein